MEGIPAPETSKIRDEKEANAAINNAIAEVVAAFKGEMTTRDKSLLESVAGEISTNPVGRVTYLLRTPELPGVSENMSQYVNQVLITLRQTFTEEEKERFRAWGKGRSLLVEIN